MIDLKQYSRQEFICSPCRYLVGRSKIKLMATKKKTRKSTSQAKSKQVTSNNNWNNSNFAWNRSSLYILVGIVVAVIVVISAIHIVKVFSDENRFHWANQRITYVRNNLDEVTGLKVASRWNNSCVNPSDQMFNNTLACTTELDATYNVTSNAQAMNAEDSINKLVASSQVFGSVVDNLAGNNEPATAPNDSSQYNVPSQGLNCDWSFTPESDSVKDGVKTVISFSVSCSAPAASVIYPNPN
jgi:hypothetical protein